MIIFKELKKKVNDDAHDKTSLAELQRLICSEYIIDTLILTIGFLYPIVPQVMFSSNEAKNS